ncbi:protein FAR1-RELATED SEQUENCE 5-like [Arachis duranensis]|uniref:Protein FAR1-RELATED SEQUENCE 5-like n=1 Tax=Arachis duranensis TaxID=130453 RepID=A0A6P4BU88_ARADU|nr:protein FAR1-RELATED SEQUENCE 5-like [Arachis duranensis]
MVEDIWNLEFRTENEACQFDNTYACWHGFVMRKDDVVRNNEGRIICRQLVCSKDGLEEYENGGYRHAGFTRKDLYNHIDRYRRSKVKNGDANATINYLIDIVAFDSTYKKNKYNKPLVIFSGYNHHGQTVIFSSGLLSDETTDTYKWLLETFVEAMGGKSPKAVITDGDLAMRDAIKNVLTDASHRLGRWYLQRNACENIKNHNFLWDFKGLIYDNNDCRDFDRRWAAILDKHNLVGSTWMEKTYKTHAMWSHCFLRDKFFRYIRTTSQCEDINSLIKFYVNRKNTFIDFMHNLDRALKEYRNNKLIADFKSQCSKPVMITSLEVYERFTSCYFTRNIFKKIRNEIQRAGALNIKILSTTLEKVEFSVTALGDPARDRRVEVDRSKNLFSCLCKLFESRGIPCSHFFCAMKFKYIFEFSDSLIYKKWTKNAKNDFIIT